MKELVLFDYNGGEFHTGVDLDNLDDISRIDIDVISGDEVATVTYKDGRKQDFDPSWGSRDIDFFDFGYTLYDSNRLTNNIDSWLKRGDSYDCDIR